MAPGHQNLAAELRVFLDLGVQVMRNLGIFNKTGIQFVGSIGQNLRERAKVDKFVGNDFVLHLFEMMTICINNCVVDTS